MLIDVDQVDREATPMGWLFQVNKLGFLSFFTRDHGPRDGSPLRPWLEAQLQKAGITEFVDQIQLVCFPRVLGYVFNPISVWFCRRSDGSLVAILYEVNNTFGEVRSYLFTDGFSSEAECVVHHSAAKQFHVSPFFGVEGAYDFRVRPPGDRYDIGITYRGQEGASLFAAQTGRFAPLSRTNALKALLGYPLLTLGVVAAIHWEALRLFMRGARYHNRPNPPVAEILHTPSRQPMAAE